MKADLAKSSLSLSELQEKLAQISDIYAAQHDIERNQDWYLLKVQEELGELVSAYLRTTGRARKKNPEEDRQNLCDEFADTICMLLLFARDAGIDVDTAISDKWLSYLEK